MQGTALICEYNPFHNGHKYQTELIKKQFPENALVCIMSGNYVQRGGGAYADKYTRAEIACMCGCDLVLELPFPYSMTSAESFASAGVSIAAGLKNISALAFGSECRDGELLRKYAEEMVSDDFSIRMGQLVSEYPSLSYPLIREKYLEEKGLSPEPLRTPNNILAVEYVKALIKKNLSHISIFTHGRASGDDKLSASEIRDLDFKASLPFIPEKCGEILKKRLGEGIFPIKEEAFAAPLLYALRKYSPEKLSNFEACGGLEHRIKNACMACASIKELIEKLSSKNYPSSRVRRAIFSAFLEIPKEEVKTEPLYTNVLAFNEKGKDFLKSVRKTATVKIFTKPSAPLKDETAEIRLQAQKAAFADSVYAAAMGKRGDIFLTHTPFYNKEKEL